MLQLTLKSPTTLPLELTGVIPDRLRDKSFVEIRGTLVWHGRKELSLCELFGVEGDAADEKIEFTGDLSSAVGIGAGMIEGSIKVIGNAGRNVGLGMTSGEITIAGDAGDYLGAEMRDGLIRVTGSAGDCVGGAGPGGTRGMTGGVILIDGDAGNDVGYRMRRGLIAVGGNAGNLIGHNMLAGTVVVCGCCGKYAGTGIKRGTLCLLDQSSAELSPTFRFASRKPVPTLGLAGRELKLLSFDTKLCDAALAWTQFNGDFLPSSKGEIYLAGAI